MKKLLMIIALGSAVVSNCYAGESRAIYSADQLFESSLQELQQAMQKAKQSNQELKSQNSELREMVSQMEKTAVSVDTNERVENSSENSWSDEVILEKEKQLYESRMENLSNRHARLSAQNQGLGKKMEYYSGENRQAQERIAALKKEVSEIQLALKSHPKQAIAKNDKKSISLKKQLAAKKEQIQILEKRLAMQKKSLQGQFAQREKYVSENTALEEKLTSGREELAVLQSGEKALGKKQKTLNRAAQDDAMARREISQLEEQRDLLRDSVKGLKNASVAVKSTQPGDLEKILKTYQKQQSILQKKLDVIRPGTSLEVRKQALLDEKERLENQITLAMKGSSDRKMTADSVVSLKKSEQRVRELKQKLEKARGSTPLQQRNQELSGQVAVLQQDLQNMRDNPTGIGTLNSQEVKEEIVQLEARRVILAKLVQDIYDRYNMDELPRESLAKEKQLKEYFQTLRMENTALQEKLLTLQMRQDKNQPSVQ